LPYQTTWRILAPYFSPAEPWTVQQELGGCCEQTSGPGRCVTLYRTKLVDSWHRNNKIRTLIRSSLETPAVDIGTEIGINSSSLSSISSSLLPDPESCSSDAKESLLEVGMEEQTRHLTTWFAGRRASDLYVVSMPWGKITRAHRLMAHRLTGTWHCWENEVHVDMA